MMLLVILVPAMGLQKLEIRSTKSEGMRENFKKLNREQKKLWLPFRFLLF